MKQTAIRYERQSTNRTWRQENSLDAQAKSNIKTIKDNDLLLLDVIQEKFSAKNSWNREWFKKLIEYCDSWKVDYIVIDEADRLSRDDLDSAIFMTILRNWKIKWIFVWGKLVTCQDMYWQFMLWLQLWASKLDNQQRSKKVKDKMITAKEKGKILTKAPFWYKNYTREDWSNDVKTVEEEIFLWNKLLDLIIGGESKAWAARKLFPLWLKTRTGKPWDSERVAKFIKNSFYRGYSQFMGSYKHNYPLVFDLQKLKLAEKSIWVREFNPIVADFALKNKLKTKSWKGFIWYITKGNVYYRWNWEKINISEKLIIESFWDYIHLFEIKKEYEKYIRNWLFLFYKERFKENEMSEKNLKKSLKNIREKKEKLLELFYVWAISVEKVREEQEKFDNEAAEIEYELKNIICADDLIIQESMNLIELLSNLSDMRKSTDYKWKIMLFNLIVVELLVDQQKKLEIQPNELFDIIQTLNKRNWYS